MSIKTITERELKLRLPDEQAYFVLRQAWGEPDRTVRQVNTYFNTARRDMTGRMVRVRDEAGMLELTVKDRVVMDADAGTLISRERTQPISPADWRLVHRSECAVTELDVALAVQLYAELGAHLYPVGSMVNTREVYPLSKGYVAELDRTELPGGAIHFEVEVELHTATQTLEEARRVLESAADISLWEPSSPKYARFLEALAASETL